MSSSRFYHILLLEDDLTIAVADNYTVREKPFRDQAMDAIHNLLSSLTVRLQQWTGLSIPQLCAASIAFNPIYWNLIAQCEYRTHLGRRLLGPKLGCYLLAISIFGLGLLRDHLFLAALSGFAPSGRFLALSDQLSLWGLPAHQILGGLLVAFGSLLVLTSMWTLGITGTYLGDYFGILMSHRVTGFPFSLTDNPMYFGSTLSFLGTSLYLAKPQGIWFTAEVLVMYLLALRFEEPYTAEIYAKRDRLKKSQ